MNCTSTAEGIEIFWLTFYSVRVLPFDGEKRAEMIQHLQIHGIHSPPSEAQSKIGGIKDIRELSEAIFRILWNRLDRSVSENREIFGAGQRTTIQQYKK
jgi:hypothetical protein